jgi:hypothetical protein
MSVDDASKMIEAVLSVNPADQIRARDAGVVTRSCEPHCAVSATTGMPVGSQTSSPASAPTIALGQSPDQVTAILGDPK